MYVTTYCSLPSSSWVLCPVLVLVVTSVLSRSYKPFPVPSSAQFFWSSLNDSTNASRFLKDPSKDSSFLFQNWNGLNKFKLLPTIRTVLDRFYPITYPQWDMGTPFLFLWLFLSSAYFSLATSFYLHNFCYFLLSYIYLCQWIYIFTFLIFIFMCCLFLLGKFGPSYPCCYFLSVAFIYCWCCLFYLFLFMVLLDHLYSALISILLPYVSPNLVVDLGITHLVSLNRRGCMIGTSPGKVVVQ